MFSFRLCLNLIILLFLTGCSASYKELKKLKIKESNNFQEYLLKEYKAKATFEAEAMHDWNSAKLYSEKALKSIITDKIYPEKISYWKLPKSTINEINIAHESLDSIYENSKITDPYNLAKAIVSLDCWSEQQEENWQSWDINKCKNDFFNSMHILYEKIKKIEDVNNNLVSKDAATIITKNKNDKIMQIIYFDFDETKLSKVSINKIKNFAKNYDSKISNYIIVGHTDTKGTKEYNLNLSLDRANVVKNLLLENGIQLSKIRILGKGETSPAIMTPDDTKHPLNRRVEIKKSN